MLSKNKIKLIQSLGHKKYRNFHKLYVVEGEKVIVECILAKIEILHLIVTKDFWEKIKGLKLDSIVEMDVVEEQELRKVSLLSSASMGVAILSLPDAKNNMPDVEDNLSLVLDTLQDPGNFGTIIRIADWYGIRTIFCSENTADIYNPKVLQATMGSFLRVNVYYCDLMHLLETYSQKSGFEIYGTFLDGRNLHEEELFNRGFIVIGNESKGISDAIASKINRRLFIPGYGKRGAESLNASVAAALVCAEFRRRGVNNL
ncbi:MAG: RNA methyltransferase [Bacteroidales bacterium]|nr:RNA methyltransferase [Bacteroidales bacterium]